MFLGLVLALWLTPSIGSYYQSAYGGGSATFIGAVTLAVLIGLGGAIGWFIISLFRLRHGYVAPSQGDDNHEGTEVFDKKTKKSQSIPKTT